MRRSPRPTRSVHAVLVATAVLAVTTALAACGAPARLTYTAPESLLCVVRHAEAWKNRSDRPAGMTAWELDYLTPEGEARARVLAMELPREVAGVWASPTQRTRQTADLVRGNIVMQVDLRLRPLDGEMAWDERMAAWAVGEDPRPGHGESLEDGAERVRDWLAEARDDVPRGGHAVAVTHGDIAALLLGEVRGTPLLARPVRDAIETGEAVCVPLRAR